MTQNIINTLTRGENKVLGKFRKRQFTFTYGCVLERGELPALWVMAPMLPVREVERVGVGRGTSRHMGDAGIQTCEATSPWGTASVAGKAGGVHPARRGLTIGTRLALWPYCCFVWICVSVWKLLLWVWIPALPRTVILQSDILEPTT